MSMLTTFVLNNRKHFLFKLNLHFLSTKNRKFGLYATMLGWGAIGSGDQILLMPLEILPAVF